MQSKIWCNGCAGGASEDKVVFFTTCRHLFHASCAEKLFSSGQWFCSTCSKVQGPNPPEEAFISFSTATPGEAPANASTGCVESVAASFRLETSKRVLAQKEAPFHALETNLAILNNELDHLSKSKEQRQIFCNGIEQEIAALEAKLSVVNREIDVARRAHVREVIQEKTMRVILDVFDDKQQDASYVPNKFKSIFSEVPLTEKSEAIATFIAVSEKLKRDAEKQGNALQSAKKRDSELNRSIPELRSKLGAKLPVVKKPRPAPQPATFAVLEEPVIEFPNSKPRQFTFRL